jgi:starch synthase
VALSIWMVASEAAPLAQVGGLADVARALPPALARNGHAVTRFLPAYGSVDRGGFTHQPGTLAVPLGPARTPVRFLSRTEPDGVRTMLVECEELFARDGIYDGSRGDHDDNARRFALLSRAVCDLAGTVPEPPDILHGHDWHAALLPLFARVAWRGAGQRPGTVLTIHNMGYQGRFDASEIEWISQDPGVVAWLLDDAHGMGYEGGISFLKAGLRFADRLTAVSPRYAWEITTPEGGFGLDALARQRGNDLSGILNGADYDVWNPGRDAHLPQAYGPETIDRKEASRRALAEAFHLPPSARPLIGVVSRLVHQKGIDLFLAAGPALVRAGADIVALGSGDGDLVAGLEGLRYTQPQNVGTYIGYDTRLSHLVVAGSDLLLVPSRYEPCGLTQMHALRYGTIPVVRRTGGLADTVRDESAAPGRGTGFVFDALTAEALVEATLRALKMRASDSAGWRALQRRAMAEDFSWDRAAGQYAGLYRSISR